MERRTKKEIVKMLLNDTSENDNEEELLNFLFDENIVVDVDKQAENTKSFGEKLSDDFTRCIGSWRFIVVLSLCMIIWIVFNTVCIIKFDAYPFILLNLFLSCVAALQAPIVLMSQNRQAKKDEIRNKNDYKVDLKSELMLEELHHEIKEILKTQKTILKKLGDMDEE